MSESPVRRALGAPEEAPLRQVLQDGVEEERVLRMWRRIDRGERGGRASLRSLRPGGLLPSRARRGLLLAAAAVLTVLSVWLVQQKPSEPLALAAGVMPSTLVSDAAVSATTRLSDGSQIQLAPGSRLEVLRNDGRSFVSVLRRGSSTFDVTPGGPRLWVIEAGLASIEVVGTRFKVERGSSTVRVSVERGVVMVRAEGLPSSAQRLTAGQSVEVRSRETQAASPSPSTSGSAQEDQAASTAPPVVGVEQLPHEQAPSVRDAGSVDASADAGDAIDAHLAAADAARRSGDRAAAIRHLEQALHGAAEHDPRRGMAALSLARLTVQDDPERAAKALEESMASMPPSLAEDALARRVEAEARAGRRGRAAELAAEYLQRFPHGHRAEDVRRWLQP